MSLVVARMNGSVIAVVGDTGITAHDMPLPAAKWRPKIAILSPDLAVAFAGDPDLAASAIDSFGDRGKQNFQSTVRYFLNCQIESENLEFLLMFNKPTTQLVRIRSGSHERLDIAWIGDRDAYEAFQSYRYNRSGPHVVSRYEVPKLLTLHQSERSPNNATFPLLRPFRYVLLDPKISSVFGSGVAVNNVDGSFQYRSYAEVLDEKPAELVLPPSVQRQSDAERAELRNYAFSCFVSDSKAAIQVVAFHFPQGSLTHLHWGIRGRALSNARVIAGQNVQQIMDAVEAEFGLQLIGPMAIRQPPTSMYGIPLSRWTHSVIP
jgi:hypothetical protein